MSYDFVLYETNARVATITLNRPEKLNALSNELRGELFHAMKTAEADNEIGVVVVKGAGRAFSAGYDLQPSPSESGYVNEWTHLPDTGTTHPQHYDWSRHAVMGNFVIWELAKPVIAQVHGYCLAGATELGLGLRPADHRRGLPGRLPAGPRDGHDGRDVGPVAPAAGQGARVRLPRRPPQRRRHVPLGLGQLRPAGRRPGRVHPGVRGADGSHRQSPADVLEARCQPPPTRFRATRRR